MSEITDKQLDTSIQSSNGNIFLIIESFMQYNYVRFRDNDS